MPRRSIIMQYLEDNEKKLAGYEQSVAAYNQQAEALNANHAAAVESYNAWMERIKGGSDTGLYQMEDGRWAQLGSHEGGFAYSNRDKKGNPMDAGGMYGSVAEFQAATGGGSQQSAGLNAWVRDPGGTTATRYSWFDAQPVVTSGDSGGWTYGGAENGWQAPFGWGENPRPANLNDDGSISGSGMTTAGYGVATGGLRVIDQPVAPTAPPTPDVPNFYEMSRREEEEGKNPTLNVSEAALAENRSMPAKTDLANQKSGGNSVFAERDKEESIKQSGILARVLAGQL